MKKLTQQICNSIQCYLGTIPYKGFQHNVSDDIMSFIIFVDTFEWLQFIDAKQDVQNDFRLKIESFVREHNTVSLSTFVQNTDYKSLNDDSTDLDYNRVFDQSDVITINSLS